MPKKRYSHFCVVASALELVGDRWTLLLVRDLLRGPQRFTDLLRYANSITPRWLSKRLRELESAGIIKRKSTGNGHEVHYSLTASGRGLQPMVEELAVWGLRYMKEPDTSDNVHPEHVLTGLLLFLNRRGKSLPHPVAWGIDFGPDQFYILRYDGNRWSVLRSGIETSVNITTSPRAFLRFLIRKSGKTKPKFESLEGERENISELLQTLGGCLSVGQPSLFK